MILSVSRRTDIPAYYSNWFMRRVQEGFVIVRDSKDVRKAIRIPISQEGTDGIVFWTKNFAPMIPHIGELESTRIPFYVQHTLTSYGQDIERNIPNKKLVLRTFAETADRLGDHRVIWRYDPILFSPQYTIHYHKHWFDTLAKKMAGKTRRCVVSLLDPYPKIEADLRSFGIRAPGPSEAMDLLRHFVESASAWGIEVQACSEKTDFSPIGVNPTKCIDPDVLRAAGSSLNALGKDRSQRAACGCVESIDLGAYDTCRGGCIMCYAMNSRLEQASRLALYNPESPIFCDKLRGDEIIRQLDAEIVQLDLFAQP